MNEVELLFTEILNCNRLSLYLARDSLLDKNKSAFISFVLKRRILGEPIQYILGKTEFMGLEFKVSQDVFIPRPETEILVETVVKLLSINRLNGETINILDIGTGSGCIAVSLAKFLSNVKIMATDISLGALRIAQYNAVLNNVAAQIQFIHSDLFNNSDLGFMAYGLIVTNPPYISTAEIKDLQPEVRYEPRIALDGGQDGLDFYRRIISSASQYLRKGGFLIMELGFNQKSAVENIFQKDGEFEIIEVVKDYNNIDRVIVARKYG